MTDAKRQFLWSQYPEVRGLFEEYNGILLENDPEWERLVARANEIAGCHKGDKDVEAALLDAVSQLEKIAKKRKYG